MTQRPHKKFTRDDFRKIAGETISILNSGKYSYSQDKEVFIGDLVKNCVENSILYKPDIVHTLPESPKLPGLIEITHESTFHACIRLIKEEGIDDTVCLNFASARNPGGGFENGAQAQEEALSRQSALFFSTRSKTEMYEYNRFNKSLLYSDYMIYSPKVPIFRNDYEELLPEPICCSIISCPATNLSKWNKSDLTEPRRVMLNRVRKIIQVAILNGNKAIVLGAYGCGVFRNDPADVANYFKTVLIDEGLGEYFDKIVFAILDRGNDKYDAFVHAFGELASLK
ncbi:hypothetical protein TRFO_11375 [Tritrichomonas foetus]|uniref:Microbial-type PARG catalytic domain-containing protein n=1 Tax=Tritrichomonas foetus TaxID=1144522 RepID=A0A1J4J7D5_9EUKA|nr:hypothetical protein TRFO_11375 [Tritrichomonas foetus]|eukprot:OHS94103.1 hypothetical protein TRFO_11375 [Tritrichomonas foetus]